MISILYPEISKVLKALDGGLMPLYLPREAKWILIIKITKEAILTARIDDEFKVYLIKSPDVTSSHLGLVTAFFDDHDEPLTITSLLVSNDVFLEDITILFSQQNFEVYFFDEHNYELLGVSAKNEDFDRFSKEMSLATFPEFQESETLNAWKNMMMQFGSRTSDDDKHAYKISFVKKLYPDDISILDLREQFEGFNDGPKNLIIKSLQRDIVGSTQEKDIAQLLRRVFKKEHIYLNPCRVDTKREIADVMIVTDELMFFIQAKDSPNTEDMLRRSLERKHQTIRAHIKKASDQMRGALIYARNNDGVTILSKEVSVTIPLKKRQLVGLVIVKELFDDDYPESSTPVLSLVRELELPINLLDYAQLHVLTQNSRDPDFFIDCLWDALDVALEHNQFPKSVFSSELPAADKVSLVL